MEFMRGKVGDWAEMFVQTSRSSRPALELDNFQVMVARATLACGTTGLESHITQELMKLHMQSMGKVALTEYNVAFVSLAKRINWSDEIIMQRYLHGLHLKIRNHLKDYHGEESLLATMTHMFSD